MREHKAEARVTHRQAYTASSVFSLDAAIECYNDLLAEKHFEGTRVALARATEEHNLTWLGLPLCGVLRPCFIPRETLRFAHRAATLVAQGLNKISQELARRPDLRRDIGLTPLEEAAVRSDPGKPKEIVGRLDGFIIREGELKFIEYNADPGAVINYYKMSHIFGALPIMKEFGRLYHVRNTSNWSSLVGVLAGLASRLLLRGGLTAIWSEAASQDLSCRQVEMEIEVFCRTLRKLALRMDVVGPEALSCRGDKVFHGRRRLAFAYVNDWEGLLRVFPFGHPFWRATQTGNLWILNSLASKVVRANKSILALLSDCRYRHFFDVEVADALAAHIPWTRLVRESWTTWGEESIDLLPFILKHREALVLKPVASQGGKGVVLGWLSSDAAWSTALDGAIATPHVVQQRVSTRHERYPTAIDGGLQTRDYTTDFSAFVWNTEIVRGYMARVSEGPLMNVSAGSGTLTPVFTISSGA